MSFEPTEIVGVCVGGRLDGICADGADVTEDWPRLLVRSELVGFNGEPICDPTNGSLVVSTRHDNILEGRDGCWCTCPLKPTVGDDNPHLLPAGLRYKVTVFALEDNEDQIVGAPLVGPVEFVINADEVYPLEEFACGECVNVKALLPPFVDIPPPPTFCDMVIACLSFTTNGTADGVTVTTDPSTGQSVIDICQVSTDAGNVLTLGSDGCPFVPPELPNVSSDSGNLIDLGSDGGAHLDCSDITGCFSIVTDGTVNGVAYNNGAWDITILSTGPNNLLTTGPDGGLILDCVAVGGCFTTNGSTAGVTVTPTGIDFALCCPIEWSSPGTDPGSPPPNADAPTIAIDNTTGQITHWWDPSLGAWVPFPAPISAVCVCVEDTDGNQFHQWVDPSTGTVLAVTPLDSTVPTPVGAVSICAGSASSSGGATSLYTDNGDGTVDLDSGDGSSACTLCTPNKIFGGGYQGFGDSPLLGADLTAGIPLGAPVPFTLPCDGDVRILGVADYNPSSASWISPPPAGGSGLAHYWEVSIDGGAPMIMPNVAVMQLVGPFFNNFAAAGQTGRDFRSPLYWEIFGLTAGAHTFQVFFRMPNGPDHGAPAWVQWQASVSVPEQACV